MTMVKADRARNGYAAAPGTGPAGETCGSCKHRWTQRYKYGRVFKCYLMVEKWTFGPHSDVKKSSPACERWERAESAGITL